MNLQIFVWHIQRMIFHPKKVTKSNKKYIKIALQT